MATKTTPVPHERVRVGRQGRVVIPQTLRQQMHVVAGQELIARIEDGRLILETKKSAAGRLRGLLRAHATDKSAVDELIAERRKAAKRE